MAKLGEGAAVGKRGYGDGSRKFQHRASQACLPLKAEQALALRRIDAAEMFRGAEGNNWAGSGGSATDVFQCFRNGRPSILGVRWGRRDAILFSGARFFAKVFVSRYG
jgi:hypothetical protein